MQQKRFTKCFGACKASRVTYEHSKSLLREMPVSIPDCERSPDRASHGKASAGGVRNKTKGSAQLPESQSVAVKVNYV
jgi:hypothetical protein